MLSQKKTERLGQFRAEIGRLLRKCYAAELSPVPDRLAGLMRRIEQLPEPNSNRLDGRFGRSD